jgi:hypothetical protein
MIVYLATNTVNGMQYVGATINFEKRVREHIRAAERNKGTKGSLAEAIKKFGKDVFDFAKVDQAKSLRSLSKKEARWISKMKTLAPEGYNLNPGGYSPEPREMHPIKVGGIVYPSFAEAVRQLQPMPLQGAAGGHPDDRPIGEKAVKERIDSGWTIEQAFGVASPPAYREGIKYIKSGPKRGGQGWQVEGKIFYSIQHIADHYGVSRYRTRSRLNDGWTIEQAVGLEPRNHKNAIYIEVTVEGRTFPNIKAAADFYGVKESTANGRLRRLGWTPEEAFGVVEKKVFSKNYKPITVAGVTFETNAAAARFYGLTVNAWFMRLHSGCKPEQAAGLEPKPKKKHPLAKETKVFGEIYPSLDEACRCLGKKNNILFATVKARLQRGWSIEDAVTIPTILQTPKKETN